MEVDYPGMFTRHVPDPYDGVRGRNRARDHAGLPYCMGFYVLGHGQLPCRWSPPWLTAPQRSMVVENALHTPVDLSGPFVNRGLLCPREYVGR
jgi:hypothetical protein